MTEQQLKDEKEQAIKRGGVDYANGYIEGLIYGTKKMDDLQQEANIAEYHNLFSLFKKGYVLALPVNSFIDLNELRQIFDKLCDECKFNFK